MPRSTFDEMTCSIARTLDVVGDTWTPLILRDIAVGITRFDAIQRDLGISRKVLTQRLGALVDHGILVREAYQDNPPRHDYWLTEKGADLGIILLAMQRWGDRWVFGEDAAPVTLLHTVCGQQTHATMCCAHCGGEMRAGEVIPQPGPGLEGEVASGRAGEIGAALERLRVAARAEHR